MGSRASKSLNMGQNAVIPIEMGRLYCSETLKMGFDEMFPQKKQVVQLRFFVCEILCRYSHRLFSANFFFHFKRLPVDSWLTGYNRFNRLTDDFHFNDDFTHCCCCWSRESACKKSLNERLKIFSMLQNLSPNEPRTRGPIH